MLIESQNQCQKKQVYILRQEETRDISLNYSILSIQRKSRFFFEPGSSITDLVLGLVTILL